MYWTEFLHLWLTVPVIVLILAGLMWRHRRRVRALARRNELLSHVMKARLEEIEKQAAKEPPT